MGPFKLFDKVRDKASGFSGTVVGVGQFPEGFSYLVRTLDKDGKIHSEWIVEELIEHAEA